MVPPKAFFLGVLLISFNLLWLLTFPTVGAPTNETDRMALLKFKESLTNDPHEVLSLWNDSVHFCSWHGVSCSRRHQRVVALDLQGNKLKGIISPYIANLSFLRSINLQNNSLYGQIPEKVGHLFRLQDLVLANNTLMGKIPISLANCSSLRTIHLGRNEITGTIPRELGSLTKLETLLINNNNLTGGIPPSLGNMSSLIQFSSTYNYLEGEIPEDFGRLKYLSNFRVGANDLFGNIPSSLFNISSINYLSFGLNRLNGTLPENIGSTLPNLQALLLGANELSGSIPITLSNISGLTFIDFYGNRFIGSIPSNLGNQKNLWRLGLGANSLGSNSSKDLDFFNSLVNCSKLEFLDLGLNNFGGVLPQTVGNLSTKLRQLYFDSNKIGGSIPEELGNLVNLVLLTMQDNLITGIIPPSFGKFQKMQVLSLSENRLSGSIPSSIGNLTQLIRLYLYNNRLVDKVPSNIGNCQILQYLDISQNNLSGAIPLQVFGLSSLSLMLNLSGNSFCGSLPTEVGNLKNIGTMDFSENNLHGEIPKTIGDCVILEYLYLQGNSLQGDIPSALTLLKGLHVLDLSQNNLSGEIPKDLQKLTSFVYLNISFNNLEGEVPKGGVFSNLSAISMTGNKLLCGGVKDLKLPACPVDVIKPGKNHTRKLTIIIIVCGVLTFILLATFFTIYWMRKSKKSLSSTSSNIDDYLSKVSYRRLHQATNGFSSNNLIGSGSFGSVYKGILNPEERAVAIKVLNLQKKGASKSFRAECNSLRRIRHRNLIKVLTCCSSTDYKGNDFKALVFEFMANGNLEKWLHPDEGENRSLNLLHRLNIAIDVASALHYLHYECEQPIIHCDLKPRNILLDSDMVAHVTDFGLARLLFATSKVHQNQSSTIGLKGTIGYAAPEYGMRGETSREGDVYSFGILVLEMFTGKRPTHEMFKDGFNLHNYVKSALPQNFAQVIDPILVQREAEDENNKREEMEAERKKRHTQTEAKMQVLVSVLEVGLACCVESPRERMNVSNVTRELHLIKNVL